MSPQFLGDPGKAKQWSVNPVEVRRRVDVGDFASIDLESVARFVTEPLKQARTTVPWKATWMKGGPSSR